MPIRIKKQGEEEAKKLFPKNYKTIVQWKKKFHLIVPNDKAVGPDSQTLHVV